ncbi:ankyrin repeat and socs box protein, putative [Paecilomyces variotii No. 5]|uniref:Profilin n=1 Tax=Byssochlamys spectabilis (strain No. 5 / NBRC 109023) TaxID=1356009 RepID=V5FT51_BYSSN|nr:ankyrin repeat and socs box protein, putative [Paecilomyces variotii No. 5]
MSWDGYLNDHVVGSLIDKAVVIDVTGAAVWAKSNGAQISPDEMKTFASAFSDKSKAEESGVSFGGAKYFFTKLEDLTHESLPERTIPTLHVAKGKEGVVASKCTQGILIAHYPEGVFFGDAIDAVVKNASHLVKNDHQNDGILRWLSAPDESIDRSDALQRRLDRTGTWLIEQRVYDDWKTIPGSFTWLHGIPGCGKTILTSTVVEDIREYCGRKHRCAVAYFYFKANDSSKNARISMLRSLMKQLFEQNDYRSEALKSLHKAVNKQQPTARQLLSTMKDMAAEFDETFLILDALDECEDRHDLLEDLEQMYQWKMPNIHIFSTSREEEDIKYTLGPLCISNGSIAVSADLVRGDIGALIRDRLQKSKGLGRWRNQPAVREEIEAALIERADGMFQWVVCQLKALEQCYSLVQLRKALNSLPKTLSDTYARILQSITKEDEGLARKILQWLSFSFRPMYIEELAQLVVVDFEDDRLFDIERQFCEPQDILRICPGLVTIIGDTASSDMVQRRTLVRLAHMSVREYLLSDAEMDEASARFRLDKVTCHISMAEFCLVYISAFFERSITDITQDFPLADYAATYVIDHYEMVPKHASRAHDLAFDFFVRREQAYKNWLLFCDNFRINRQITFPTTPRHQFSTSPLSIAAYFDLIPLLEAMLNSDEVDTQTEPVLAQALRFSYSGRLLPRDPETVRLLLGHGARFSGAGDFAHNLHGLCYFRFDDLVAQELDNGADVNNTGGTYRTALGAAISGRCYGIGPAQREILENTEPSTVRLLLSRGADPNLLGYALSTACYYGDMRSVQLLLEYGAHPNVPSVDSWDCVSAACHSRDMRILDLMFDRGAEANGPKALISACKTADAAIIRLLLDKGADPNPREPVDGSLPLHITCGLDDPELSQLLLDAGADPNALDGRGNTPLQVAISLCQDMKIIRMLVEKGADINRPSKYHGSPLEATSFYGYLEAAEFFIDLGADINAVSGIHGSPLRAAINCGHGSIAILLLKCGSNLDTPEGRYGQTLRDLLASAPDTQQEISICLGKSRSRYSVFKRSGKSFLDFDNLIMEERLLVQPDEVVDFDCSISTF